MHFIDGKGQKLELKSSRNVLTNHAKSKSRHQLFMAWGGGGHTHTHFGDMKVISRNQAHAGLRCAPGLQNNN